MVTDDAFGLTEPSGANTSVGSAGIQAPPRSTRTGAPYRFTENVPSGRAQVSDNSVRAEVSSTGCPEAFASCNALSSALTDPSSACATAGTADARTRGKAPPATTIAPAATRVVTRPALRLEKYPLPRLAKVFTLPHS
ncbi:hypothetical protein KNE206_42400 [Kitasatospora sp. NE20-6]